MTDDRAHREATADFFDRELGGPKVMGIFRGASTEETVRRSQLAWAAGVSLVEVPVSSPEGWDALAAVIAAGDGRPVGVGTILTTDQVERAAAMGATFTVSPGFDPEVSAAAAEAGLFHLPGVGTASEITAAINAGHRWLKAFPASVLGPEWIAAMLGPFPGVSFVCTGGMSHDLWPGFEAAGARAMATGRGFE